MIEAQDLTLRQMGSLAALGPGNVIQNVLLSRSTTEVMPPFFLFSFISPFHSAYVQFRKRANRPVLSLANAY